MIRGSFHMSGLFALRIYSELVSDVKERVKLIFIFYQMLKWYSE